MPRKQLKEDLEALQAELESMEDMDDALRGQLEGISTQIDRLTEGEDEGPIEELMEEIEERVLVFDAMHPQISGILKRIVSALAAIGA
ncbi:MAG: phage shock protein A [Cognaticolwellia sp.]|jgi:phage shock protein A